MNVPVTVKVRREIVELADRMVKCGIARSRSHAFNVMIERGLAEVLKEVEFWENVQEKVGELEAGLFKLRHGGLSKLLLEDRER